ncbi:MAG: hypothetical protein ACHQ2Y_08440, partial [Candidatus Lutacidiplasmatales archaeon]
MNVSGLGPVPTQPDGSFVVPGGAWSSGQLNLTLDAATAGTLNVAFSSGGLPMLGVFSGNLTLRVGPDHLHLLLNHPTTAELPGMNDTLYRISDRFGNPAPPGFVEVRFVGSSGEENATSWVELAGTESLVWVNYSYSEGPGTVYVISEWGEPLLGPLPVSTAGHSPSPPYLAVALGGAAVALGALAIGRTIHRRRRGAG